MALQVSDLFCINPHERDEKLFARNEWGSL
jgi:hypothetical protein